VGDRIKGEPDRSGALMKKLVQQQFGSTRPGTDRSVKSHTKDRIRRSRATGRSASPTGRTRATRSRPSNDA
jgi:hypothetical protein